MDDLLRTFAKTQLIKKVKDELLTVKKDGKPIKDEEEFNSYVGSKALEFLYGSIYDSIQAIDSYGHDANWTLQVQVDMITRISSIDAEGLWRIIRRLITGDIMEIYFGTEIETAARS